MARPLLRRALSRLGGALFSPGQFIPAVTRIVAGQTILVSPEIVVPKGVLRSKTVGFGIIAAAFGFANVFDWNLWLTEDQANHLFDLIATGGGIGAVISRILAWMPTRGPTGGG